MLKRIVGGVATLVIGGTTFAIHQSDVVKNLSQNTGMTQQQAQQYVNNIPQSDLESFSKVGQGFVDDANTVSSTAQSIDCANYSYNWETPSLACQDGKNQLQNISSDESNLGTCFEALNTNLGNSAKNKINECISDIDAVDSDYSLPIVSSVLDTSTINDTRNTNAYNKSVLEAALNSN